jgi:hypothetical protein
MSLLHREVLIQEITVCQGVFGPRTAVFFFLIEFAGRKSDDECGH